MTRNLAKLSIYWNLPCLSAIDSVSLTLNDVVPKQCLKPLSPFEGWLCCMRECVRFPKSELSLWICISSTLLMQMRLAQVPHSENHHGVKDTVHPH